MNGKSSFYFLSKKLIDKSKKFAELGTTSGFKTKSPLKHGFNVIVNDREKMHLNELWNSVNDEEKDRLSLEPVNSLELS